MIRAENLCYHHILEDVDLELHTGPIALVGPNRAGKSTLLALLAAICGRAAARLS